MAFGTNATSWLVGLVGNQTANLAIDTKGYSTSENNAFCAVANISNYEEYDFGSYNYSGDGRWPLRGPSTEAYDGTTEAPYVDDDQEGRDFENVEWTVDLGRLYRIFNITLHFSRGNNHGVLPLRAGLAST